jgi:hypothetical protein
MYISNATLYAGGKLIMWHKVVSLQWWIQKFERGRGAPNVGGGIPEITENIKGFLGFQIFSSTNIRW